MANNKDETSSLTNRNYLEEKVNFSHDSSISLTPQSQSIPFSIKAESSLIQKNNTDRTLETNDTINVPDVSLKKDDHACENDKHPLNTIRSLEKNHEIDENEISSSDRQSEVNQYNSTPPQPSKIKLKCTKRRAGVLYKQLTSSKVVKETSKYFSHAHKTQKRWIPPRSPYALVQEDLFDSPWQLLVATVFLTKTAAKRALPQLHKFLARFPRPEDVLQANYEDIDEYFKPLGLTNTRSHIIMRFTVEFLEKDWTYPRELYGIGKYGDDSYRMFCINEWRQVSPDDIPLTMYRNWLLENADRLGIT